MNYPYPSSAFLEVSKAEKKLKEARIILTKELAAYNNVSRLDTWRDTFGKDEPVPFELLRG